MSIRLPDIDYQAEADTRLLEHVRAVSRGLDEADIMERLCDELRGNPDANPLSAWIASWKDVPEFDWRHPLLPPSQVGAVGRYVLTVLAAVFEQALERALARED